MRKLLPLRTHICKNCHKPFESRANRVFYCKRLECQNDRYRKDYEAHRPPSKPRRKQRCQCNICLQEFWSFTSKSNNCQSVECLAARQKRANRKAIIINMEKMKGVHANTKSRKGKGWVKCLGTCNPGHWWNSPDPVRIRICPRSKGQNRNRYSEYDLGGGHNYG